MTIASGAAGSGRDDAGGGLVKCPECGNAYIADGLACPFCHAQPRRAAERGRDAAFELLMPNGDRDAGDGLRRCSDCGKAYIAGALACPFCHPQRPGAAPSIGARFSGDYAGDQDALFARLRAPSSVRPQGPSAHEQEVAAMRHWREVYREAHDGEDAPPEFLAQVMAARAPVFETRSTAGAPVQATTNVMAVLALVFGVVSGPIAIVFGHVARSQIRRTGQEGSGMATAGLVLGYLWLAAILWILIAGASA